MNRSLQDIEGGLLLVLAIHSGRRHAQGHAPGVQPGCRAAGRQRLFDYLVHRARERHRVVQTGEFGAHMQVTLTNDGPVTFWLQVAECSGDETVSSCDSAGSAHVRPLPRRFGVSSGGFQQERWMGIGFKELLIILAIALRDLRREAAEDHRLGSRRCGERLQEGDGRGRRQGKPPAQLRRTRRMRISIRRLPQARPAPSPNV